MRRGARRGWTPGASKRTREGTFGGTLGLSGEWTDAGIVEEARCAQNSQNKDHEMGEEEGRDPVGSCPLPLRDGSSVGAGLARQVRGWGTHMRDGLREVQELTTRGGAAGGRWPGGEVKQGRPPHGPPATLHQPRMRVPVSVAGVRLLGPSGRWGGWAGVRGWRGGLAGA